MRRGYSQSWPGRWSAPATMIMVLVGSAITGAAEYFVAPWGSNANAGTSAAPWATLQYAAGQVDPGDRVVVRPGEYQGFHLTTSGMLGSPIEFFAEPGAIVVSDNSVTSDGINLEGASHIIIDGFTVTGVTRAGVRSVEASHVTIRNVHAYDNGRWGVFTGFVDDLLIENNHTHGSKLEHGIYVSNSGDRPVLRGNHSWGNRGSGIHMNGDESAGGDGIISDALIERNLIHDNSISIGGMGPGGGSGINMDGVQDSRIVNNILFRNHASGISLYRIDGAEGSTGNLVVNNTIHQPADGRYALNIRDGSTGNTVLNNILITDRLASADPPRGAITIEADSLAGLMSDYNILTPRFTTNDDATTIDLAAWRDLAGNDLHSLVSPAPAVLFIDPADGDYRLKPGAIAENAGAIVPYPAIDFFGVPRPQGAAFDIGAAETPQGISLAADFNGDNVVNAADLAAWRLGFGTATGASKPTGDANADGDADGHDFLAWQSLTGATAAKQVPEQHDLTMLALCVLTGIRRTAMAQITRRR